MFWWGGEIAVMFTLQHRLINTVLASLPQQSAYALRNNLLTGWKPAEKKHFLFNMWNPDCGILHAVIRHCENQCVDTETWSFAQAFNHFLWMSNCNCEHCIIQEYWISAWFTASPIMDKPLWHTDVEAIYFHMLSYVCGVNRLLVSVGGVGGNEGGGWCGTCVIMSDSQSFSLSFPLQCESLSLPWRLQHSREDLDTHTHTIVFHWHRTAGHCPRRSPDTSDILPLSVTRAHWGRGRRTSSASPKKKKRLLGCVSFSSQPFEKDDSAWNAHRRCCDTD